MSFFTLINCMDGRVQLPVINYVTNRFDADYVDSITEPGPNLILSEHTDSELADSIIQRVDISVNKHKSQGIVIAAHHDCTGNPADKDLQISQVKDAMLFLNKRFPGIPVTGIWVNENWEPAEI